MHKRMIAFLLASSVLSTLACRGATGVRSTISVPTPGTSAPSMSIDTLVGGLDVPWSLAFAPDGRIFVTERPGRIRIVSDGRLLPDPWAVLDVAVTGEGGLLGLAIDPGFSENRFVYVAVTYRASSGDLRNKLVRFKEEPATGKGGLDKVLLDNVMGSSIHDGGRVKFGPDGKLYWTIGDAGNMQLAQDLSSLNGKILRLNPDGTIPPDNPFPNSPVYSYGNRNAQGLAWQPRTGRLYETEHGPSGGSVGTGQDEVNYIQPGNNYGWPSAHGSQSQPGMMSPMLQSGSATWAPSGATFVVGGPWDGSLLFAGLAGQTLYRLMPDTSDPFKVVSFEGYFVGQYGRLRDVVQGPDGAFYILTNNRDGRGIPRQGDDRILHLTVQP